MHHKSDEPKLSKNFDEYVNDATRCQFENWGADTTFDRVGHASRRFTRNGIEKKKKVLLKLAEFSWEIKDKTPP